MQATGSSTTMMIKLSIGGFCAILIGMGIERFSYTPILTVYVSQGWLNINQASYLGSINLLGYMIGALAAWHLNHRLMTPLIWVKLSVILCSISLLGCSYNNGFIWFSFCRFIAGFTGAILITTVPSLILPKIPNEYIGRINGVIFTGTPVGILLSGYLVPFLDQNGLSIIWLYLGSLSSFSAVIVLFIFNQAKFLETSKNKFSYITAKQTNPINSIILNYLTMSYSLSGFSFVPYTLFLVAYLEKIGIPNFISGEIWMFFGIGGVIGTFFVGYLGDIFGIQRTLIIGLFLAAVIFVFTILVSNILFFYVFSLIIGMFLSSNVSLMCGAIKPVANNHQAAWAKITLYFALGQALGAYLISFLINNGFSFELTFVLGAVGFIISSTCTMKASRYYIQNKIKLNYCKDNQ